MQQAAQRREVLQGAGPARGAVRAPQALSPRAHVQHQDWRQGVLPTLWPRHASLPSQRYILTVLFNYLFFTVEPHSFEKIYISEKLRSAAVPQI